MATFNDETKKEFGRYFEEGIYKVTVKSVLKNATDDGKEYFEFVVTGDGGEEGNAKLWWTEKAMQRSFNAVRALLVHNTVEANKEKVRAMVDATTNTDELYKLALGLVGKEAWYQVEMTGQQYQNAEGEWKNSYNRNIYGFEPKPKKPRALTPEDLLGGEDVTADKSNDIPFN